MPRSEVQPNVHASISDRLGEAEADKFCRLFGGHQVYIPARPSERSRLAVAMGMKNAQAIADLFGAANLVVPLHKFSSVARRRAMVIGMLRAGRSNAEMAKALGCHTRTVTRICTSLRKSGRLA